MNPVQQAAWRGFIGAVIEEMLDDGHMSGRVATATPNHGRGLEPAGRVLRGERWSEAEHAS